MVINQWSRDLGIRLAGRRFHSRNALARFNDKKVVFLRPLTFMNQSGKSIRACADYYNLKNTNILVIHDDLDLPVGKIKVAKNGGAGGHLGVSSIIQHLGTMQFPRVRIGIGRPRYGEKIEDYVLRPFYKDEKNTIKTAISTAVHACELFVSEGVEPAMNQINCQNLADKGGIN